MVIQALTTEKKNGYKMVYCVNIPKINGKINANQLKFEIKYFVSKQVTCSKIEVTPIFWKDNKEMVSVSLGKKCKYLFVINKGN